MAWLKQNIFFESHRMTYNVALIPARSGSKGVVDKNIRLLGGQPLIAWSIRACEICKNIDRIILSTDSEKYAEIARDLGCEVPFLRPASLAGDKSTDFEFVAHALDFLSAENRMPDHIFHIRPTTPLRKPEVIDRAFEAFLGSTEATALRSVHEMSESAYKTFEMSPSGYLKTIGSKSTALDAANNARQIFPKTYSANGYVDILSVKFIKETSLLHGNRVLPFVTERVSEIDIEEDFSLLQLEVERQADHKKLLFNV